MSKNEQYLNELRKAKEKYMVTDFGKYLEVTQEIINKYEN